MGEHQRGDDILVAYADDHNAVRKGIISYLEDLGGIKIIIEAANGKELSDKIAFSETKPDICIIDINMPVMNGFETVAYLGAKWPGIRTLVLSVYVDDRYVIKMIRAGANGYLPKSCDPEEIKTALIAIYSTGRYHSPLYLDNIQSALSESRLKMPSLTEREIVFLKHCCSDMTYIQIAQVMKCTAKSVEGYRDSLFRKIQVNSRVSLALFAVKTGIVTLDKSTL